MNGEEKRNCQDQKIGFHFSPYVKTGFSGTYLLGLSNSAMQERVIPANRRTKTTAKRKNPGQSECRTIWRRSKTPAIVKRIIANIFIKSPFIFGLVVVEKGRVGHFLPALGSLVFREDQ